MKLHKIEAGAYLLTFAADYVARIDKTGRPGVDDYPWEWHLLDAYNFPPNVRNTGNGDTLTACVDTISTRINQYGITKTNPSKGIQK